uniref:RHS repeat-associated core domain-containing protein n=1 Tax=Chitinivorax sp. B TaxID=2502235 RepID=UPI0024B5B4AA
TGNQTQYQWYHTDPAGSVLAATDGTGNLLWRTHYRPYGEKLVGGDGGLNREWYTGKTHDDDTGLDYFGARYYDAVAGRFLAMDPVDVKPEKLHSFNRYGYANNNPYRFVDRDGRDTVSILFTQSKYLKESVTLTDHTALAVFQEKERKLSLYDPSGSYAAQEKETGIQVRPEGGLFENNVHKVSIPDFARYHAMTSQSQTAVFSFTVTPEQAQAILTRAEARGDAGFFSCTTDTRAVISGIGPFKDISTSAWKGIPGILRRSIKNLHSELTEKDKQSKEKNSQGNEGSGSGAAKQ